MVLNNFWPWSGGMAQYVSWSEHTPIPYPPPHPNGSWDLYQKYAARFYTLPDALQHSLDVTGRILERKNGVNQKPYKEDPVIMAWELANEPRGIDHVTEMLHWIESMAAYIKSKDPNHLVTVGAEGYTSSPEYSGTDFKKMHESKYIDYTTAHIWIQNWGWYNPAQHDSTYSLALSNMKAYLTRHAEESFQMGKPFVLEEFGIMKDSGAFDPAATTVHRDDYYSKVFEEVVQLARQGKASGVNFWAYSGEGRPREPGTLWHKGDGLTGDPPHEPQGWYSVYDKDVNTQQVIRYYAAQLKQIVK
jgi:mannan endo-1,4-beta-mannosidase